MLKQMKAAAGVGFLILGLYGCSEPKGSAFQGHWIGKNGNNASVFDIKYSDGVFHIDHHYRNAWLKKDEVNKLEATASSDDVLAINTGLGSVNMRLENGKLLFENKEYEKTN